ncbi:hypothetical protein ABQ06_004266 [Salmonella enterica subsp. enterica serovar Durham]|nr:hypothetical protein [Salmonella enterica]EGI5715104.1 hypothetical protein [Salmonella enterica subsp. enterica serovar Durham]EHJ9886436.1 hypothetical protein [Salmonella enterica]EIH3027312.1 hypothetical protein [Salmonella enterica subsp. enterica serovar Telelkebir]
MKAKFIFYKIKLGFKKMSKLSSNVIGKEIQKLKEIKSQLEREAPEMVTPEVVAAIYKEINEEDRINYYENNKF